jgi:hypothetical protein
MRPSPGVAVLILRYLGSPGRIWVVVFIASYFSSTDVSNELCAANDYDRELVDQLIQKLQPILSLVKCTGRCRNGCSAQGRGRARPPEDVLEDGVQQQLGRPERVLARLQHALWAGRVLWGLFLVCCLYSVDVKSLRRELI